MVKLLHLRDYQGVSEVGNYYRQGDTVVMDLTSLASDKAQRLVDFAAGLVVACGGDMDRIAPNVFLLLPPGTQRVDS